MDIDFDPKHQTYGLEAYNVSELKLIGNDFTPNLVAPTLIENTTYTAYFNTGLEDKGNIADKLNGIEEGAQVNPTASQLLTSLKTADGSGSGLDADLLDGKEANDFVFRTPSGSGSCSGTSSVIVHNLGRIPFVLLQQEIGEPYVRNITATEFTIYINQSNGTASYWYW